MDVTDCVSSSGWPAMAEGRGGECWAAAVEEGGGGQENRFLVQLTNQKP